MNKPFSYSLTKRQINKVKGWEVTFYDGINNWGNTLGFFKTMKEARDVVAKHKHEWVSNTWNKVRGIK